MLRFLSICCFIAVSNFSLVAQTGCPGCEVSLPADLPADTLFLGAAPDGEVGLAYSEDLSFRLPMTTTPVHEVDPETPAGIGINTFTILGLVGLPPGLQWEVNQTEFAVAEQTDGCVKICGTPLLSGLFEVEVVLDVNIFILTQQTSFSFFLLINPAETTTDGFSIENNAACGSLTTNFTNNVPSNGLDGFTYFWDFGNGNSTTAETPNPQTYTAAGDYEVNYEAIVDTAGFFLTTVVIEQTPCTDLFNAPDLKFDLFDPDGEHIFTAPIVGNATLPITYSLFIPIEEGNYELHVIDDDGGLDGADDLCGIINFNSASNGELTVGDLVVNIELIHPVDTIQSREIIHVYPIPAPPLLSILENTPYCEGTPLHLIVTNYANDLSWSLDSLPIIDNQTDTLIIDNNGEYAVFYTSENGCISEESVEDIEFLVPPASFVLQQDGNLIRIEEESNLPTDFSYNWFFEGELIASATDLRLCTEAAGNYSLLIIDNATGCSREISIDADYDSTIDCTTPVVEVGESNLISVYPNPFSTNLHISNALNEQAYFLLFDALGRQIQKNNIQYTELDIDMKNINSGIYFYKIQLLNGAIIQTGSLVK